MIKEFNIEIEMPAVEEARKKLKSYIENERRNGTTAVFLIHGYGSHGVGGALRNALRKSLSLRKREGVIREFYPAEKWDILKPECQKLSQICPEIVNNVHLLNRNPGVTLIIF